MDDSNINVKLDYLKNKLQAFLSDDQDWTDEFDLLFKRAIDDRPMALARARRVLEILLIDQFIALKKLTPPFQKQIGHKKLFSIIREVSKKQELAASFASLCHAIRLEANNSLHYHPNYPNDPKTAIVADDALYGTLHKLIEVVERVTTGGYSIYLLILPQPLAPMYKKLREEWAPNLEKKEGKFSLLEGLELLFRSIASRIAPEGLKLLMKYNSDNTLSKILPQTEEDTLRQLRNLSLIKHDEQWLFTPTRSKKIWLTESGKFLLALHNNVSTSDTEKLARQVIENIIQIEEDKQAIEALETIQKGNPIQKGEIGLARRLRNLHLITHSTYFLQDTNFFTLTDFGYYVLGKHKQD